MTSKIKRIHPLTMVNMSAKFDKETCNGVVSIVFTRSTHGQTEPRTHARMDGTTKAWLYVPTATCCAGMKNSVNAMKKQFWARPVGSKLKVRGPNFNCKVKVPFFSKCKSETNPPPPKKKRHAKETLMLSMFGSFNTTELCFSFVGVGVGGLFLNSLIKIKNGI